MSKFDKLNPMLLTDFYKTIHHLAYVPKLEYLVSYWTPRKSRYEGLDKCVIAGHQMTFKRYLIEYFNENFFNRPWDEIENEYKRIIANTMSIQASDTTELKKLWELQYLPLQIRCVPEGTVVNIKTPVYEFRNTVSGFGWVVNALETYLSVNLWHPINSATVAWRFRQVVNEYFDKTVSPNAKYKVTNGVRIPYFTNTLNDKRASACGDFSMRGMNSIESAAKSSGMHLLSFSGSATISAIPLLEEYYHCDCEKELIGLGVASTEHSVMSSYLPDNEFFCYKHLIEDVFPEGPLSIVSDTYDYWNVIVNYTRELKDSIMKRNGKVILRGDSGCPEDILCGTLQAGRDYMTVDGLSEDKIKEYFKYEAENTYPWNGTYESYYNVRIGDYLYHITCYHEWTDGDDENEEGYYTNIVDEVNWTKEEITPEMKGTVEVLWDIFGGYINDKGYKVLDEHIGTIYGDAITYERIQEIYKRLADKGFAVNNATMGIGSFTYQMVTRDSLSQALKATCAIVSGEERHIFKSPKTDAGAENFKKSQRGICHVFRDKDGNITYTDGHSFYDTFDDDILEVVFKDGKMIKEYSLKEIRDRLHDGKF